MQHQSLLLPSLLQIKNLTVGLIERNTTILLIDDISFSLNQAKTLALIGESGCGKSLTALALLRLLPVGIKIFKGTYIGLNDKNLINMSEVELRRIRGRDIAIIFQDPHSALNPVLTIYNQIKEILQFHFSLTKKKCNERILQLLKNVGIPEPSFVSKKYPHQLSGGLKQRVCIAMALATNPKVLIADEITTALDVTIQAQILTLLKKLQKEHNMAILLITHDLGVARQIADDIAVMYKGKIVEQVTVEKFFQGPNHFYSQQLLKAVHAMDLGKTEQRILDKDFAKEVQQFLDNSNTLRFPLLRVRDLVVSYSHKANFFKLTTRKLKILDHVSLDVRTGEVVALVGESGCGKTTLAKTILNLITADAGKLLFNKIDLLKSRSKTSHNLSSKIQIIFQDPLSAMNPRMIIEQILLEGLRAQNLIDRKEQLKQVKFWVEQVSLSLDSLSRYPHQLSGGQRSRISLARALILKPQLLILDEPTSALDVSLQAAMLDLLKKLQCEHELSYLIITHNLGVVRHFANYVVVMYLGRIIETGHVSVILKQPLHPYTQLLFQSVPKLDQINLPFSTLKDIPSFSQAPLGCHFHPRCPHVMAECRLHSPPLFSINSGIKVRCWLYATKN